VERRDGLSWLRDDDDDDVDVDVTELIQSCNSKQMCLASRMKTDKRTVHSKNIRAQFIPDQSCRKIASNKPTF